MKTNFKLNQIQQECYNEVLFGNNRIVLLTGSAGTGKTALTSKIATDFDGEVLITATTNKAKDILAKNTDLKTYTTHSAMGFRISRIGLVETFKKMDRAKPADLLIIDEYSMLTDNVWQVALKGGYKKILLVGDEDQLKEIGVKAKITPDISFNLTQNHRQPDENIAEIMMKLRQGANKGLFVDLTKEDLPDQIKLYNNHREFCKAYKETNNSKRILAYSNRVVDSYNLNIKSNIRFSVGDFLILNKPVGKARNGDIVQVDEVKTYKDHWELKISNEIIDEKEVMVFKTKDAQNLFLQKVLKMLPASYWTYKDKIIEPKHLYATTIHKAQGQTIPEVFIDLTDIYAQIKRIPTKFNNFNKPISIKEMMKLIYVAVSRMQHKAHIFVGPIRNYTYLRSA